MLKTLSEAGDLKGKRVLVRVDWNVPAKEGKIMDDFRIHKSKGTLDFLAEAGSEIIIASHFTERIDSGELERYLPAGAVLLPNLRENPGEEANTREFAKELASKADVYVNEAFSASHRNHASITGVPGLIPGFAGFQFVEEVANLSKAFSPAHPCLLILGGAKFETKIPLVEKFLNIADHIHIAGANAVKVPEEIASNPKVTLPIGDIAALDGDEANLTFLKQKIDESAFIVWNGPLGKYEDGYTQGTESLAHMLALSKQQAGKEVIVGGADTLAVIKNLDLYDKFSFVSTGGGAMLDFLATGTLPGIEALS